MTQLDIIYIQDLSIETIIGIHDWERCAKQKVCLNIDLMVNIQQASQSDRIGDTVDFALVAKTVTDFVTDTRFLLIETLAERVAELILREFKVHSVRLRAAKIGIVPNTKEVGVLINRSSEGVLRTDLSPQIGIE